MTFEEDLADSQLASAKASEFFKESPEYSASMSITEKYNTHFASQYREKVRSAHAPRIATSEGWGVARLRN